MARLWRGHETAQIHGRRVEETCNGEGAVAAEVSEEEPVGTSIEEGMRGREKYRVVAVEGKGASWADGRKDRLIWERAELRTRLM